MCGLFGVAVSGCENLPAELIERAETATRRLAHRGPDQWGSVVMGGVFIGQLPPPAEGEYELRGSDQQPVRVRLTWTRKVADYVSILGLEVLGEAAAGETPSREADDGDR